MNVNFACLEKNDTGSVRIKNKKKDELLLIANTIVRSVIPRKVKNIRRDKKKKLDPNIECTLCHKILSDKRNLNRHLRSVHDVQPKVRKVRVKCSFSDNCSFVCATNTVLRTHLETVHGFDIVQKKLHFDNRPDFEKWKEEEEIRTCSRYVTDTGVKNRKNKKIFYLRCHRSGPIRAEQNNKKERLRSRPLRGYTQCGFTCPSSMQITESQNGNIEVSYYPKHLGHKTDDDEGVQYLKLRRKEKEEIAAKLVQGESVSKIVREARVTRGEKLSRVNFLQRKDVYNIKSSVKFLEKEMDQDGRVIDTWINQLRFDSLNDNPIVYYKPVDKDNGYILVIIHNIQKILHSLLFDGSMVYIKTKKGKANVDFNLTVLYAINENGDGYPLAFCISNKTDNSTIMKFFKIIYNTYGIISAQIFISDNINHYYVTWKSIMGKSENKLICNFDIHAHWKQRLLDLKCPFQKLDFVSNKLKSLLNETDPDVFESELVNALNSWSEDQDLKSFNKFFYKFYCKKPYEWANYYRIHSLRQENINKYLSPLYEQIEHIYAAGIENVQNTLKLIFHTIRNECYMKLVKWDEDILMESLRETEKCHTVSKIITEIKFNGSEWVVYDSDLEFCVKKEKSCSIRDCDIMCYTCGICIHSFSCNCKDYLANFTICVHIHAVATPNYSEKHNIKNTPEKKYLASSDLKISAVSLSKKVTEYLDHSDLSDTQYDSIMLDLDKLIKKYSLKEACVEKLLWGSNG